MAKQLTRKLLAEDKSLKAEDLTVDFSFFTAGTSCAPLDRVMMSSTDYNSIHAGSTCYRIRRSRINPFSRNFPYPCRRGIDDSKLKTETSQSDEGLFNREFRANRRI